MNGRTGNGVRGHGTCARGARFGRGMGRCPAETREESREDLLLRKAALESRLAAVEERLQRRKRAGDPPIQEPLNKESQRS